MKITGDIRQELGEHYDLLQYNLFVNSSLIAIKGRRLNNKQLKQALSNRLENNFFRLNAIAISQICCKHINFFTFTIIQTTYMLIYFS